MNELGRIIIADDEESFLKSTAYLLRREGYHCDCAVDTGAAEEMLGDNEYDLIISDIKMPGNAELEFVRSLPIIAKGMPVILVTAYPSLATAIESVQLPVVSYMVKPLDFGRLLDWVRIAMQFSDTYEVMNASRKRLEDWHGELNNLERFMCRPSGDASEVSISDFLNLTLSNVAGALLDLKNLTEAIGGLPSAQLPQTSGAARRHQRGRRRSGKDQTFLQVQGPGPVARKTNHASLRGWRSIMAGRKSQLSGSMTTSARTGCLC
jgi:DNA-binding response OmpR family regulator